MLPDLRAAVAAIVAAVSLLLAGFGVAATFRVAQQTRPSPLQAARSAVLTEPALRVEDLAPVVSRDDSAAEEPVVAPAAEVVAAPVPAEPADAPAPTGSVAAVAHADAPVAAVPAPAAEPPAGGPLEQAALTPAVAPDARPIVRMKPRAAIKPRVDWNKARAKAAAKKRLAAARARRAAAPQNAWQNSWQQSWPAKPSPGFDNR